MKRGFVDTPDGQIHYREVGEGEPVIILHPTPLSAAAIAPFIEAVGKGARAIGMDTMGYGDSDTPPKPYTDLAQFAQAVAWLIEGLGLKEAHVFGCQTGGQIALQLAADRPDLVKSLVVQEAFNWNTEKRREIHLKLHRYDRRTADGSYLMEIWRRTVRAHDSLPDLRQHEIRFLNLLRVNEEEGAEVYGPMGWEGAAPYCMTHQDVWEVSSRISCPVLVTYVPGRELYKSLPRFLDTIKRSKGIVDGPSVFRQPEETARMALDFFRNPGV